MSVSGTTTLVVPCYQEAARLPGERFLACARARPWLRLLMVDDGSRDGTPARLSALAAELPGQIGVLTLAQNLGKAEAVRRGLLRALEENPHFVGFWDADLATPLEEIDDFVAYLAAHAEVELLYGSRVLLLGRQIDRRPLRHFAGRIMATLASWVLDLAVYDTQCGAKLFRPSPRLRRALEEPFLTRWIFDVELLARWRQRGPAVPSSAQSSSEGLVHELPVKTWREVAGSKVSLSDFASSPLDLWRIHRHYRTQRSD